MATVAEELTEVEKERLDISKWYVLVREIPPQQIKLFFRRLREITARRVTAGDSETLEDVGRQLKGISFVESKFLAMREEAK